MYVSAWLTPLSHTHEPSPFFTRYLYSNEPSRSVGTTNDVCHTDPGVNTISYACAGSHAPSASGDPHTYRVCPKLVLYCTRSVICTPLCGTGGRGDVLVDIPDSFRNQNEIHSLTHSQQFER